MRGGATPAAGVAIGGALAMAGLWWLARRGRRVAGGGLIWLGLGAGAGAFAGAPARLPATVTSVIDAQEPVSIDARIVRGPEEATRGARLVLDVERIGGVASAERLSLAVVAGWPDVAPGERIRLSSRLRAVRGLSNPGLPDPTFALRAAGVDLLAGVSDPSALQHLPSTDASIVAHARAAAFRARRAMRAAIDRALSVGAAAFLQTAVLGERRGVDADVEAGFRAAGATHVLSVSGLHLAAVAVIFIVGLRWLLGWVPRLALYVDPRAVAAAAALPAVAFFVLLTGEAVATMRAALMLGVALGAALVNRPPSAAATVGAAGLVLLLGSPLLLFDVSLQLSLASVAGIALLARAVGPRGRRRDVRGGVAVAWLWRFGAATLSATAVTAPLGAHHFGEVAPASPIGNLLLVPLVEMVVVPFGLAGAALATVAPVVGRLPLSIAGFAANLALAVARFFHAHAPIWLCRAPSVFETLMLIAASVLALAGAADRGVRRRRLLLGAALALGAAAISLGAREVARRTDPDLRITFVDVGQGDAALVEAPGGHTLLIDGGGSFDGSFDPGERVIEPLLRARGIDRLDLVALSHPHPDHLNGLHRVLERFAVAGLWTSGDDGRNPDYARLLATARRRGVDLPVPAPLVLGGVARDAARPMARRSHRCARRPERQRRVAGAAPRLRGPRRDLRRRSRGRRRGRAGRAARAGRRRRRRRAQGSAPRQQDVVDARAGGGCRAVAGGDLARLAEPLSLPRRRCRRALRGARDARAAHRSRRRHHRHHHARGTDERRVQPRMCEVNAKAPADARSGPSTARISMVRICWSGSVGPDLATSAPWRFPC